MSIRTAVSIEDLGPSLKPAVRAAGRLEVDGLRLSVSEELRPDRFSGTAARQLLLTLQEYGMAPAGLCFPTRRGLADPERLERRIAGIRKSIDLAARLKCSDLLLRTGRIPDPGDEQSAASPATNTATADDPFGFDALRSAGKSLSPSPADQFRELIEILNELAAAANHQGVTLQLIVPNYDLGRLRQLVESVRLGPVFVILDPATALMTGRDPVSIYRDLHPLIGQVRARDAVRDVDGAGVEVAPTDGEVRWEELIPTLRDGDFRSWLTLERLGGEQRAADVTRGWEKLRPLLRPEEMLSENP